MEELVLTTYISLVVRHEKYNFLANNLHIHERYLSLALKEHNLLFTKKTPAAEKPIKEKYYSELVMKVRRKQIQQKRMTRFI